MEAGSSRSNVPSRPHRRVSQFGAFLRCCHCCFDLICSSYGRNEEQKQHSLRWKHARSLTSRHRGFLSYRWKESKKVRYLGDRKGHADREKKRRSEMEQWWVRVPSILVRNGIMWGGRIMMLLSKHSSRSSLLSCSALFHCVCVSFYYLAGLSGQSRMQSERPGTRTIGQPHLSFA